MFNYIKFNNPDNDSFIIVGGRLIGHFDWMVLILFVFVSDRFTKKYMWILKDTWLGLELEVPANSEFIIIYVTFQSFGNYFEFTSSTYYDNSCQSLFSRPSDWGARFLFSKFWQQSSSQCQKSEKRNRVPQSLGLPFRHLDKVRRQSKNNVNVVM